MGQYTFSKQEANEALGGHSTSGFVRYSMIENTWWGPSAQSARIILIHSLSEGPLSALEGKAYILRFHQTDGMINNDEAMTSAVSIKAQDTV